MPNRLANETSPYLLQHKDNPVDWYAWGEEAFEAARAEKKPIFLSIGYSACHWCHVMEHESFEDEETAALMNANFINVKVDREERPDVDSIYMAAVQAMTGRGGWPMSIFMTPDAEPFYAGTYFPPDDHHGMPGFQKLLTSLADAYANRKGEVLATSNQVLGQLQAQNRVRTSPDPLTRDILREGYSSLAATFDAENGGFGAAPKFPQPLVYEYLLRVWAATGERHALEMVKTTLVRMARGGMYDQLGGGFHRYSVDGVWLAPHFEKMLYDNALLVPLYLHAWQATGDPFFRGVAEDILRYVEREMLHPEGGFYSAQDADSEGVEGKFFTWSALEIAEILGRDLAKVAVAYWGISENGNFEGKNILWAPRTDEEVASELGIPLDELCERIGGAKKKLFEARERRVKPGLDDKILTSWNALMQRAFADAGAILANDHYTEVARKNADFLLGELVQDERVLRTWKDGAAKLNGYLEDYSLQVDSLISLYEATFEDRWLTEARRLADRMIELFWDEQESVFYDTGSDHEELLVRPRDVFDNAQPCGGSAAAAGLLRLAVLTGESDYERYAASSLRTVRDLMARAPSGVGNWLAALDWYTSSPKEVILFGPRKDPATRDLLATVHGRYIPNKVVAGAPEAMPAPVSPLLAERDLIGGRPTAYVCEDYSCSLPVNTAAELAELLAE